MFSTPDVEKHLRQRKGRSLITWVIAAEATTPEDIAFRQDLHKRYLEPFLTTLGQYKTRLKSRARGTSARSSKSVPVLLFAGEVYEEEDNQFIRWVYRK